jgi:hypothetical protein
MGGQNVRKCMREVMILRHDGRLVQAGAILLEP